jgi:hypothetical protein
MAFNINEFKTKMDKYGGPAKTNLFQVVLTGSIDGTVVPAGDLVFFCQTVQIPGINFNLIENRPQGIGLPQSFPISYNTDPLNCIFILDSNHQILSFFHLWMQNIINFDTSRGLFAANAKDPEHFPHEINYRDDYEMTMQINYYGTSGTLYTVTLEGIYPSQIGSLNLSWDANDQIATLPVNFSYNEIKFEATRAGEIQSDISRGYLGLQRSLVAGGRIQQAVDSFTSISNNVFTALGSIRNTINTIKSIF